MFDTKELSTALKKSLDPTYKTPEEEALEKLKERNIHGELRYSDRRILLEYFERKIKGE